MVHREQVLDSPHDIVLSNSQEALFKGFSYVRTPPEPKSSSSGLVGSASDLQDEQDTDDHEED
jgi:hypothetical protein